MLPPNVTAGLDHLASIGVLDYDAAADIAGSRPRYYGHPQGYVSPFVGTPMDNFSFSNQYNPDGINYGGQRNWLRLLATGALALGGLYFGGKLFLHFGQGIKNLSFKNLFKSSKKTAEKIGKDIEKTAKKGLKKGKKAVNQGTKKVSKLGKTPWYKKAANSISDGWDNLVKKVSGKKHRGFRLAGRKIRF